MAIIRIHTGPDGKSHFEDVVPRFEPRGDKSASAELIPGSGIVIRRFDANRSNPWHHAPGRAAVFTLSGAVDIEIGDGTVRRLGPGDILIAEDLTGQGHVTREVGHKPKVVEGLAAYLVKKGALLRLPGGWIIAREPVEDVIARLRASGKPSLDVGEFKEMFGLTRRLAIPLLEYLDASKVTRRVGDRREIVKTKE